MYRAITNCVGAVWVAERTSLRYRLFALLNRRRFRQASPFPAPNLRDVFLSSMRRSSIKTALLQVHSVIGLAISLLLTVAALTGVTMSFEDEIQASLNAGITHVEARSVPTLTPDELIARLQAAHDFGKVSAITMASDPS